MRPTSLALAAVSVSLALASGLAHAADQVITVPPFTSVENTGPISVTIDVGPSQSVKASGSSTFLELLKAEVVDGQLKLSMRDKVVNSLSGDPKVTITMPQLNAFTMAGAGSVNLKHVNGDRLDVTFGGAGSLRADGRVRELKLNVGGVGEIDTRSLVADNADVRVGGVGSVKVTATTRLDASVGGIGSLTYYGRPKVVNTSGGGLGSIDKGD